MLTEFDLRIHEVPRSHVSFPMLPRDETLAIYRSIAEAKGCRWGEAILFLLLDFCGNDLALVREATEFLPGDWSDKLYDASVWDRIHDWLGNNRVVQSYRQSISELPDPCKRYLGLLRLGGKPPCPRPELSEELDSALRALCLRGLLVQNLIPHFYQLRNLTVRLLADEPFIPWSGYRPETLFRKATNERVSHLLQDVETMLRSAVLNIFQILGQTEVISLLQSKQGDADFLSMDLNRALLDWADKAGGPDLRQGLNAILVEQRKAFRERNSVWSRIKRMMEDDANDEDNSVIPEYLRCVEYLTFGEVGDVVVSLLDRMFPGVGSREAVFGRLRDRWLENLSKVRRLRNRAAHLRNIDFQDAEDLTRIIEDMRKDLIDYAGWR